MSERMFPAVGVQVAALAQESYTQRLRPMGRQSPGSVPSAEIVGLLLAGRVPLGTGAKDNLTGRTIGVDPQADPDLPFEISTRPVIFIYARAPKGPGRGDYSFLGHICRDCLFFIFKND